MIGAAMGALLATIGKPFQLKDGVDFEKFQTAMGQAAVAVADLPKPSGIIIPVPRITQ